MLKKIVLWMLVIASIIVIAACTGVAGMDGKDGKDGDRGSAGPAGEPGVQQRGVAATAALLGVWKTDDSSITVERNNNGGYRFTRKVRNKSNRIYVYNEEHKNWRLENREHTTFIYATIDEIETVDPPCGFADDGECDKVGNYNKRINVTYFHEQKEPSHSATEYYSVRPTDN